VECLRWRHDDELIVVNSRKSWSQQLKAWAIPDEILVQAPTSPWIHPVEMFEVSSSPTPPVSSSTRLALDALPVGGSVLDIGCGGGRGSMSLAHRAQLIIGVDHQQDMLQKFAEAAQARNVAHQEILGDWPSNAKDVPIADVAIAHHVIYNVSDLEAFGIAMNSHARKRVVLEAPNRHPLAALSDLWKYFWDLERPEGPTAQDALNVFREIGFDAKIEYFADAPRQSISLEKQVEFTRIRLCLPESKDAELREILVNREEHPRELAVIWW
jgi:SAM-dependent methyltransferase